MPYGLQLHHREKVGPRGAKDIWQKFDSGDAFALESSIPEMRRVRQFEVTYLRVG